MAQVIEQVSLCALQDTTTNPLYTGQKEGLSLEDARIARLMKKYEGFVIDGSEGEKQKKAQ